MKRFFLDGVYYLIRKEATIIMLLHDDRRNDGEKEISESRKRKTKINEGRQEGKKERKKE
jgi:hypothetical protein